MSVPATKVGALTKAPATWTKTDSTSALTSNSVITWSGANFGSVNSNRVMVIAWSGSTTVASSVTIGGVAATRAVRESTTVSGLDIWYASVSAGTSGTIVISAAGSMTFPLAFLGQVVTTTPTPPNVNSSATGGNPATISITVPANGVAIAAYVNNLGSGADTITWTSATSDGSLNMSSVNMSEAHTSTTGSPSATSGQALTSNHMVAAAWSP